MSSGSWPNFNAWLQTAWGAGGEFWSAGGLGVFSAATNLVFGDNPPYYLDDFAVMYPKFFGVATAYSGFTTTAGSTTITGVNTAGLSKGQFVQSTDLPSGSVITGLVAGGAVVSQAALSSNANSLLQVYTAPPIPTTVVMAYLRLATASLVQARWCEEWWVAIGLFIAHYCTLYAETDATDLTIALQTIMHGEVPLASAGSSTVYIISSQPPGGALQSLTKNGVFLTPVIDYTLVGNTITLVVPAATTDVLYAVWPVQQQITSTAAISPAQIAAQGVATGIMTSKSVGDVSAGYTALTALEDWGAWNLTKYGQLLATMARVIGAGPMVIW